MMGVCRHSAACVVACTLSSVADHTLCRWDALGDVLQHTHKTYHTVNIDKVDKHKVMSNDERIFCNSSSLLSPHCFHCCYYADSCTLCLQENGRCFCPLFNVCQLCATIFPCVVSGSDFYLHKDSFGGRTALKAKRTFLVKSK